jgi:hypothetical protein
MHLWEVKGFQSSSVKTLYVGQTANGQDCIGCSWDDETTYVYAYDGIIDTFMMYMERYNSVGKAMAFTKLKDGMEDKFYFAPCAGDSKRHNQLYRFDRYSAMERQLNLEVHHDHRYDTPEDAIKALVNNEVLSGELSHFVTCMTNRVTA